MLSWAIAGSMGLAVGTSAVVGNLAEPYLVASFAIVGSLVVRTFAAVVDILATACLVASSIAVLAWR